MRLKSASKHSHLIAACVSSAIVVSSAHAAVAADLDTDVGPNVSVVSNTGAASNAADLLNTSGVSYVSKTHLEPSAFDISNIPAPSDISDSSNTGTASNASDLSNNATSNGATLPKIAQARSPGAKLESDAAVEEVITEPDGAFLARNILKDELQLLRLTEDIHLGAANPSFPRARRVWLWDICNAISTEAGLIAATALFYEHSTPKIVKEPVLIDRDGTRQVIVIEKKVPNTIPPGRVVNTIVPQIVGQSIGAGGALLELSADFNRVLKIRRQRLNGALAREKVTAILRRIDERQSQLDHIAGNTNDHALRAESNILRTIRDFAVSEFARVEAAGSSISISRFIEDSVSLSRNVVGIVGNSINVAGLLEDDKRLNGQGNILNLISASMITTRPFVSNLGAMLGKKHNEKLAKEMFGHVDEEPHAQFDAELDQLKSEKADDASALARIAIYERLQAELQDEANLAQTEKRNAKQLAVRRYRESIYGPTKMAQAIITTKVNFRHESNATKDNDLSAAANLTYTSGQVFNIAELLRERIVDETKHKKLKQTKMLPEDRIGRSMGSLDLMRNMVSE